MEKFEEQLRNDLHQFLQSLNEVDERMPECPDVEDKWEEIAKAYIPDGIREFQAYPSASLGWMMYIGLAVAKMWDTEWEIYSKGEDLYAYMRDKRGYDAMDEYIREEVLLLQGDDYSALEKLTGECAQRVYNALMHQHLEPGTKEASSLLAAIFSFFVGLIRDIGIKTAAPFSINTALMPPLVISLIIASNSVCDFIYGST